MAASRYNYTAHANRLAAQYVDFPHFPATRSHTIAKSGVCIACFRAIDTDLENDVSDLAAYVAEPAEVWTENADTRAESGMIDELWLDEEFVDSMADIINENFVLDVKACHGL